MGTPFVYSAVCTGIQAHTGMLHRDFKTKEMSSNRNATCFGNFCGVRRFYILIKANPH